MGRIHLAPAARSRQQLIAFVRRQTERWCSPSPNCGRTDPQHRSSRFARRRHSTTPYGHCAPLSNQTYLECPEYLGAVIAGVIVPWVVTPRTIMASFEPGSQSGLGARL